MLENIDIIFVGRVILAYLLYVSPGLFFMSFFSKDSQLRVKYSFLVKLAMVYVISLSFHIVIGYILSNFSFIRFEVVFGYNFLFLFLFLINFIYNSIKRLLKKKQQHSLIIFRRRTLLSFISILKKENPKLIFTSILFFSISLLYQMSNQFPIEWDRGRTYGFILYILIHGNTSPYWPGTSYINYYPQGYQIAASIFLFLFNLGQFNYDSLTILGFEKLIMLCIKIFDSVMLLVFPFIYFSYSSQIFKKNNFTILSLVLVYPYIWYFIIMGSSAALLSFILFPWFLHSMWRTLDLSEENFFKKYFLPIFSLCAIFLVHFTLSAYLVGILLGGFILYLKKDKRNKLKSMIIIYFSAFTLAIFLYYINNQMLIGLLQGIYRQINSNLITQKYLVNGKAPSNSTGFGFLVNSYFIFVYYERHLYRFTRDFLFSVLYIVPFIFIGLLYFIFIGCLYIKRKFKSAKNIKISNNSSSLLIIYDELRRIIDFEKINILFIGLIIFLAPLTFVTRFQLVLFYLFSIFATIGTYILYLWIKRIKQYSMFIIKNKYKHSRYIFNLSLHKYIFSRKITFMTIFLFFLFINGTIVIWINIKLQPLSVKRTYVSSEIFEIAAWIKENTNENITILWPLDSPDGFILYSLLEKTSRKVIMADPRAGDLPMYMELSMIYDIYWSNWGLFNFSAIEVTYKLYLIKKYNISIIVEQPGIYIHKAKYFDYMTIDSIKIGVYTINILRIKS